MKTGDGKDTGNFLKLRGQRDLLTLFSKKNVSIFAEAGKKKKKKKEMCGAFQNECRFRAVNP